VAWDQLRQRAGLTGEQWESQLQRFLDDARQDNPDLAADIESRLHLTSANSFEIGLGCLIEGIASKFIEHRVDATTSPDQRTNRRSQGRSLQRRWRLKDHPGLSRFSGPDRARQRHSTQPAYADAVTT
jgi:hypothetical protein